MKNKITIFAFLFITSLVSAQSLGSTHVDNSKFNLGLRYHAGRIGAIGIEAEYFANKSNISSYLFNVNFTALNIKTDYGDVMGYGYELGVGSRNYLSKKKLAKGLYVDSYLNYGSIKFDKDLGFNNGSFNFEGKFQYISILNSSIGYKFQIKKIFIEPSLSARYNIEIKGKGDIDNKDIDNFLYNAGIRLGYSF